MPAAYEHKACRSCAKAKRRCGREQPSCRRCRIRGEACDYLPAKHSTTSSPADAAPRPPASSLASPEAASRGTRESSPQESSPQTTRQCLAWFLGEQAWAVEERDETLTLSTSFSSGFLRRYITTTQGWIAQWTATGECPFIHSHLYIARFPTDLQVAYTTYIAYANRVPGNAEMMLKIVEDQASKLVADSGAALGHDLCFAAGSSVGSSARACSTSLLDQLAQLQALVIYEVIGLFDGDIRLRHLSEGRLAFLVDWSHHLLDSARQKFASSPTALIDITLALHNGPMDSLEHPWYLWILSESIRRTWLVATSIQGVYFMMQRGWHPCPGGVMVTTRQGIWSAKGSQAWEKLCTEKDVGFLRRFEIERLFLEARPQDVDEFTQVMMEITYGSEPFERWKSK